MTESKETPKASDGKPARSSGAWVSEKRTILDKYCGIFSKGVSAKWGGKLTYVDLFCGPGLNLVRSSALEVEGSPLVALRHRFARYVFVDTPPVIAVLKSRLSGHPKFEQIVFIEGDCNERIDDICKMLPADHLNLAFIDPTGLHIHFETIRRLAAGRKIDLLMTIQFGMALNMNLPQYINTEGDALSQFLGNTHWRGDITSAGTIKQLARVILARYKQQLVHMGFIHTKDEEIVRNDNNTPLYSILLATRSELGTKFWREITKIDSSGQREMLF